MVGRLFGVVAYVLAAWPRGDACGEWPVFVFLALAAFLMVYGLCCWAMVSVVRSFVYVRGSLSFPVSTDVFRCVVPYCSGVFRC